ncbi:adenosylcobinamide-GDP ribazoletransferase [Nocardia stercoris]|uniref:Adenosylcobinamide-GDP ribazoletransferase n=1 Tax=Nocardia stercoris TaxID=2483361 RepID=A0A3M2KV89_9NOCA|nr:adenosylcobinamide-GDP ribazoletransferase [Nocardia stercoris]RMI29081.1 adenosylcobinamide-GDP ribazoletransferase [Nocardia stercoris]
MDAIRLVLSWLTVLPVRGPDRVDRGSAGRAIALAPVAGILLGAIATGLLWSAVGAGTTPAVAGLVTVGASALLTRGMHLDGLADTLDGLGSYGPPERAREIMKSGGAGPFGVAALIFAVTIQAFAFAALAGEHRWLAVGLAVVVGRVAVVWSCRRGIEPAPGAGFGALVAGTQSPVAGVVWTVLALAAALLVTWWAPVAVLVALAVAEVLTRHCVRRFGGLNGDVLGAVLEVTVTVSAVVWTLDG